MHRGMISTLQKKNFHTIEGIKILNPNESELKAEAIRPTDIENSKSFLIRSGCDQLPSISSIRLSFHADQLLSTVDHRVLRC